MDAITFVLTDLETGRALAHALVCPEARYVSVWASGTPRPDRRHVAPATWRQIEADLALGLPSGPLDASAALCQTLVPPDRRRSLTVQYVARLPVEAEPIIGLAERLDRLLKGLSSPTPPA